MLVVLAGALLLPSLFYPLARDQGVFAYAGSMILRGGWPYRDVWDLKPPGVYYAYAAMVGCGGATMAGVRACDLLAAVATSLILYAALRRLIGLSAAWLGALLYAPLYLQLGFWGMAQAESYANLWTAAALYAWQRCSGDQDGAVDPALTAACPLTFSSAAGAAAAVALLFKVTALPPLAAALGAVSLLRARRGSWQKEARRIALFLIGLTVPLALTVAVLALSGAGAAYLDIQRGFVSGYVAMTSGASGAAAAGWRYFWRLYSVPTVVAAGGVWVARRPARFLLGAWLIAAVASAMMQRKYFGYHWTPVLLPLAALAGVGVRAALSSVERQCRGGAQRADAGQGFRRRAVCTAGALLIAGWSAARGADGYMATARLLSGQMRLDTYWGRFGRPYHGDFSLLADAWAAAYIRRHTRPSDPVYIWGFEPLTLFLAGRRAPTRFVFAVPLVAPWSPPRWREELMRDLRRHPPVLFGVMRHDAIPHASGRTDDSAAQLEGFPALHAFLRDHYRFEKTIEDLTLYRRRTGGGGPRRSW